MSISKRMVKLNVELSEFSIEFYPRKAIKAQTLSSFIAEFTFSKQAGTPAKATKNATPKTENDSMSPSLAQS